MKRISVPALIVTMCAVVLLAHRIPAKADSRSDVYLPAIMNASGSITPPIVPTQIPVALEQLRTDTIAAINAERQKTGCALVVEEASLTQAAQVWSDYMVANNVINHSDTVDVNWYLNHGYTRSDWLYENIAVGPSNGAAAVAVWMSDEGHKAAVLAGCENTSSTFDIGVGFNLSRWTMVIGELHTAAAAVSDTSEALTIDSPRD